MEAYSESVSAGAGSVIDMAVSSEAAMADTGGAAADVGGSVDVGV